jgi:hypothetical protein
MQADTLAHAVARAITAPSPPHISLFLAVNLRVSVRLDESVGIRVLPGQGARGRHDVRDTPPAAACCVGALI